METVRKLSSEERSIDKIKAEIREGISNEYIKSDQEHGNFNISNYSNFPLLKAYHTYLEKFVNDNNIQAYFWSNGNIMTHDRIYFFQKLKYLELLDGNSHKFRVSYWKRYFKNPVQVYEKVYEGFPDRPLLKWQTKRIGFAGKPLLEDKSLPKHFNLWALKNYPLFPCTNGKTLKMDEVIIPSLRWFLIRKHLPILDLKVNRKQLKGILYQGEEVFKFRTKANKDELREAWKKKFKYSIFK